MDDPMQLQADIIHIAKRQKIIEDAVLNIEDALIEFNKAISEWSEFMTIELFKQGTVIHKNKRSFEYFRSTLRETHKQNYEKFESILSRVKGLYGERKPTPKSKYNKYISYKGD